MTKLKQPTTAEEWRELVGRHVLIRWAEVPTDVKVCRTTLPGDEFVSFMLPGFSNETWFDADKAPPLLAVLDEAASEHPTVRDWMRREAARERVFAVYLGPELEGENRVQPRVLYPVLHEDTSGFDFMLDGAEQFGLWSGCGHLDDRDWHRVVLPEGDA